MAGAGELTWLLLAGDPAAAKQTILWSASLFFY
jgi:hypothetical protein